MSDNDSSGILEGTVDEVKDRIRESDDLDLEALLEEEENGDDRKTVKEFIQSRMDGAEEEEEAEEEQEDSEEEPELAEEEIAREIEEETSGGLFGSFSREMLFAAGIGLGLLIGLAVGMGTGAFGTGDASPGQVQQSVQELFQASSPDADVSVTDPEIRNGLYYMNVSISSEVNGTEQSSSQQVYVTTDGEKMFPVVQSALFQNPIDIEQTKTQLEQTQGQAPQGEESPEDTEETNQTQ
jgi:hypothetical protein